MLRWELPQYYESVSVTDVCDMLGHSYTGEYFQNIPKHLTTLLCKYNDNYIPTSYERSFTQDEVCVIINNEDPAYMSSYAQNGTGRHGTALCGYLIFPNGAFAIRIMNPGTGEFQLSDYGYSSTDFRYTYNGTYFIWDDSVRLLYQHG